MAWPAVVTGFGTAVAVWIAWYVLHLPAFRTPPEAAAPLLLAVMAASIGWWTRSLGASAWRIGLGAGLVAALINLLILGSKLSTNDPAAGESSELVPSAPLIVGGFVAISMLLGAAAGWAGGVLRRPGSERPAWIARFGVIALAALAPLIAIGGAVTSAGAGMAVPDWPGTYGSNMFLYPIGLMADPYIFLEHTHRLFGTLVGLTTLTLMVAVLREFGGWGTLLVAIPIAGAGVVLTIGYNAGAFGLSQQTLIGLLAPICLGAVGYLAWSVAALRPGPIAAGVFATVCLQGMLGALRVTEISPAFGAVHGVMAQLILAASAVLAVTLVPAWSTIGELPSRTASAAPGVARLVLAATACLLIQLTLAALFRHTGSQHALWTHIGFSLITMAVLGLLGFVAQRAEGFSAPGRVLNRLGRWIIGCTVLQMALGLAAWAVVGDGGGPGRVVMHNELGSAAGPNVPRTLVATAHQANGALLIGLAAASWAWAGGIRSAASVRNR